MSVIMAVSPCEMCAHRAPPGPPEARSSGARLGRDRNGRVSLPLAVEPEPLHLADAIDAPVACAAAHPVIEVDTAGALVDDGVTRTPPMRVEEVHARLLARMREPHTEPHADHQGGDPQRSDTN